MADATVVLPVRAPTRARAVVAAWAASALVFAAGAAELIAGWGARRPSTVRSGGWLIAASGVVLVLGLFVTRGLARCARHQRLLLLAIAGQTVQLSQSVVQYAQVRRLDLPLPRVVGFASLLNAEWVPLMWLWLVLAALVAAHRVGCRSRLLIIAAAWTLVHSLEHLYLVVQFARVTVALDNFGLPRARAIEMLPGVLGRDGWVARHVPSLRATFGPVLAAPRASVHLWWAIGDVALPLVALVWWRRRSSTEVTGAEPVPPSPLG